jgi:adenosylcobyric acid synthase
VTAGSGFDYRAFKERQYDLLAGQVRKAVDLDYIYSTLFL